MIILPIGSAPRIRMQWARSRIARPCRNPSPAPLTTRYCRPTACRPGAHRILDRVIETDPLEVARKRLPFRYRHFRPISMDIARGRPMNIEEIVENFALL